MADDGAGGRRIVRRFYLFQVTRSVGFVSPVFALFVLRNLTYPQYGALSALYAALVVVGEVPTGYVGDRVGRRASMAGGVACAAASLAGFVVVESFAGYAALYALWALAAAFDSGSADAWLYETLDARLDADAFTRIRGRAGAVRRWTSVVTTLGGGLLYAVDPRLPFVASVALSLAGFAVLASLPASAGDGASASVREAVGVVRASVARSDLRGFVPYVAVVLAAVGAAGGYVQPIGVDLFRTLLPPALSDVPEPALLGVMYACFTGVAAVAADSAGAVEERLGVRGAALAVPAAVGALMLLPPVALAAALPMFVARTAASPLLLPIAYGYVNDRVGDAGRATTLSAVSMAQGAARAPLAFAAGLAAGAAGAVAAPALLGAAVLVAVVVAAARPIGT